MLNEVGMYCRKRRIAVWLLVTQGQQGPVSPAHNRVHVFSKSFSLFCR